MAFIMASSPFKESIVLIHHCWNMYLMTENLKKENFWLRLFLWELFDPFSISLPFGNEAVTFVEVF